MSALTSERVDVLVLVVRRWRLVCTFVLCGLAIGVTYAVMAKPTLWYQATITVLPSQHASEPGTTYPAHVADEQASEVLRIRSVLTSTSVRDAVIDAFELDTRYGTADRQATREVLARRCTTSVDRRSELVTLSCKDESPELAAKLAELFGEEGNRVFERISLSSAREERSFLAGQVERTRRDVDEASRKLREFQRAHRIVDLTEQSRAVISAMAAIKGEVLAKQLELSYLAGFSADDEASVVQLKRQIRGLKRKLAQLEGATGATPAADFFPSAMSVPDLRFELESLVREQRIQETLYMVLLQRYETAKVDEARDTSTFQFLDHATVPTRPLRPRNLRLVALAGICGLAFACAWILVPVWWQRRTIGAPL